MKGRIGLLGEKIGMTQIFEEGVVIPVTVVRAGPCYVSQIKTKDTDNYNAIQLAFKDKKEKNTTKPLLGHFKKAGISPKRFLREFRVENVADYKLGQELRVDIFKDVKWVDVTGITKGRGFAGVVKRWNKKRGPESHGSMTVRAIGSIGQHTFPGRVLKGKRMPGHYGVERVTVKNLKLVKIIDEKNLLLIKGAIPGANNGLVIVTPSYKNEVKKVAS